MTEGINAYMDEDDAKAHLLDHHDVRAIEAIEEFLSYGDSFLKGDYVDLRESYKDHRNAITDQQDLSNY